jgi:hypothetical protein
MLPVLVRPAITVGYSLEDVAASLTPNPWHDPSFPVSFDAH